MPKFSAECAAHIATILIMLTVFAIVGVGVIIYLYNPMLLLLIGAGLCVVALVTLFYYAIYVATLKEARVIIAQRKAKKDAAP